MLAKAYSGYFIRFVQEISLNNSLTCMSNCYLNQESLFHLFIVLEHILVSKILCWFMDMYWTSIELFSSALNYIIVRSCENFCKAGTFEFPGELQ